MNRTICLAPTLFAFLLGCVEVSSKTPVAPAPPLVPTASHHLVLPNGERLGSCPDESVVRGYPSVAGALATYCATSLEPSVRHGPFASFYPSGKLLATGDYMLGDPHGEWRTYHENGQVQSQGQYSMGVRDGAWTFRRADGALLREETLSGGVRRMWTEYDHDAEGLVAFEAFRAVPGKGAVSEGRAGRRLASGDSLTGTFLGGKADGVWEAKTKAGLVTLRLTMAAGFAEGAYSARWSGAGAASAEGQLLKTLPQGEWLLHTRGGQSLAQAVFEKGLLRKLTVYHESGQIRLAGELLDGAPHGKWTLSRADGSVETTGTYAKGIRQGMWRTADASGATVAEGLYEGGVLAEGQSVAPLLWSEMGLSASLGELFEALAFVTAGRGRTEIDQRLFAECMLFGDPAEKCLSLDWESTPGLHAGDGAPEIERRNKLQDLACAMNNAAACARVGKRAMPRDKAGPDAKKAVAAAAGFYQKACDLSPTETAWKARDATARAMYKGFHSASACVWLGELLASGDVKSKAETPAALYKRACDQGLEAGCSAAEEAKSKKPAAGAKKR